MNATRDCTRAQSTLPTVRTLSTATIGDRNMFGLVGDMSHFDDTSLIAMLSPNGILHLLSSFFILHIAFAIVYQTMHHSYRQCIARGEKKMT